MARTRFKCQLIFIISLLILDTAWSLPILRQTVLETTESAYTNVLQDEAISTVDFLSTEMEAKVPEVITINEISNDSLALNGSLLRQNIRPGQEVRRYTIQITRDGNNFNGRAVIDVRLTDETREDPIVFDLVDLTINNVLVGVLTEANAVPTDFDIDEGLLEIFPIQPALLYIVVIEYSAPLRSDGLGLYLGDFDDGDYIAMNLHPTNARRVFPCMDEPLISTITSLTFNDMGYVNMVSNSMLEVDSQTTFRALEGPTHLWGMVAHNFNNINIIPAGNVHLFARPGVINQEAQASIAINNYITALNEWTDKPHSEIILNQDGRLVVIAVPDVSREWSALSSVCIWEPYMLMETVSSVKQRKTVLVTIAEAMSRQWFGYVLHADNWRHQWVITGLNSYVAYEIARNFQTNPGLVDPTLVDMNTIFTLDVIQESLLLDSYSSAQPLEAPDNVFDEDAIRLQNYGLVKYKSPAILRMFRLVLGDEDTDYIQEAARALLISSSLQAINTQTFNDALGSVYSTGGGGLVVDFENYIETWLTNVGYPLVHVVLRQGNVLLTQERFGFSPIQHINFEIPVTFTTSINPNFDDVYPTMMMEASRTLSMNLGEEDWVLINLQGQGYYRVNYDTELWERIIMALEDPDRRQEIHPLNRATLIDDALNLARAGKLDYETAFRVVLTMEHETEYAVWRAFVRNMDFLRKRLVALVTEDEELDPDIYLRMVRRTVIGVENELGFHPDNSVTEPAMQALTRGLVMDHACRSGYIPCIAAAVDWFYDPNNNEVVNPNIPPEIRPSVYCTMVREGDDDVINALYERIEIEQSSYERLVILESLGCSQDEGFIQTLLAETIADNSPYRMEERLKIFIAVASSSFENAREALNFMSRNTNAIRNSYGGPEKLEEAMFALAENMASGDLVLDYTIWVNSQETISNLEDSKLAGDKARDMIAEDLSWNNNLMEEAYEWIDDNDAPTIFVSTILISISLFIALFNY